MFDGRGLRFIGRAVAALLVAGFVLSGAGASAASPKGKKLAPADDFGYPQVRLINERIRLAWKDYGIKPSKPATDGEWCRRVHLDILGRIPSQKELLAYVGSTESDKRAKLVADLLFSEKYTEEYARNMTTIWTNVLIGRSGGTERNSLTSRPGLQKYLRDSFAREKPYDRMVEELISATGSNTPGAPNFNGAVNFLTMKLEDNGAQATAKTAQVFMGLQVQCTQCHNHPFNEWKQRKFWEMNAFFRQTAALRSFNPGTRDITGVQLIDQDFAGEGGNPEEAEVYYELRNGLLKVAYPVFVDGSSISRSGFLEDANRRGELAKMVAGSEYTQKAIVNRTWAHFMGYGFTKPIDDMGPHNPATHPVLVEELGKELRKHSYNLKELMRWIVLSEAYSLSSRTTSGNTADDPLLGETPKFSHFYLRQMRAEELYESLLVATQAQNASGSYEQQEDTKREWLRQFVIAFGNDEGIEATTFNGTIPQALMMFNGGLVKRAVSTDKGGFLWNIAHGDLSNTKKINFLFESALARKPTKNEVGIANKLLVARKGDATAALQDLWWAVLNSNEFIINH